MDEGQEELDQENGYGIKCIRVGQVRRYGDSEYHYIIRDLRGGRRPKEEMLAFARKRYPAPMQGEQDYTWWKDHFISFEAYSRDSYLYRIGHEYLD